MAPVLSSFRTQSARREGLFSPAGLVLSFTLLGLLLRLTRLDFQPLWWDEGYSAWFATHPLGEMIRLTAEDIHPPLYYALLHAWTLVAGTGPVSLRLVSVAAGVAAIPLMYAAASHILGSQRAGLLAAFLLAINPLHVFYSQEVRMYGLVALLSLGVLWAAWGVLRTPQDPRAGILSGATNESAVEGRLPAAAAYIILTTLALYTQYYAIFLPIGLTVFALWHWRREPGRLLRWFALQAVVALLYLPWVIYAGPRLTLYVSQKVVMDADRPLGLLAYLGRHLSAFAAGHLEGGLTAWQPLALVLLVPVAWGLVRAWRSRRAGERQGIALLATVLLVALFLGWLIGLRYPFFPDRGERLLLLALPAFIMLTAAGLDGLLGRGEVSRGARLGGYAGLALFIAASVISLIGFYTIPRYADDDYRPLIARTVEQGLPGDTVFAVYPWQVGYWRSYAGSVDGPTAMLSPSGEWGPGVQAALDVALARGRVWFPAHLALGAILETQIEKHLASAAIPFANIWYGPGTRLSAWQALSPDEAPGPALDDAPIAWYEFAGDAQLDLAGVLAPTQPVAAANAVAPITLAWRSNVAPPDLAVSVRLVDDLSQIWAQNDYEPLGKTPGSMQGDKNGRWEAVDRFGLLVPAGTPPGRYRAELVVRQGERESTLLAQAAGTDAGSAVRLFDLEVAPADRPLTPERLPIAERQSIDLDDGVRFLGYTIDRTPLAPGELRRVNLFWQATDRPSSDYMAFVQMIGKEGAPVAAWEAAPGAAYPTSQWDPGALIRTQAYLRPGAEVPDGRYQLIAGLYQPADGVRLKTAAGMEALDLGSLIIKGRPHQVDAEQIIPSSAARTDATFGEIARLAAYEGLSATLEPTGTVEVTLYWEALGATETPYTVFVHLVDEQTGAVIGYGDSEPGNGAYPTTGWLKGEYLADPHTILPSGALVDGQPARIEVGLYDPATGQRLTLPDGTDVFVLWRGQFSG